MKHLKCLVGAWLLLLASCGAHRLSQAQTMFNDAARMEASTNADEERGGDLVGSMPALQNYRGALLLADSAITEYASSLQEDQLYGTALVLKALCHWRIAELDREGSAADAKKSLDKEIADIRTLAKDQSIVLGTRDRVLLAAMPGLLEHTMAMQTADREQAGGLFESALETLDLALSTVNPPADHAIRTYIRLAQMRSVRAWRWVMEPEPSEQPEEVPLDEQEKWDAPYRKLYVGYRKPLEPLMKANPGLKKRVLQLDKDFGYMPPSPKEPTGG